jgi:hypothetical protein
MTMMMMMIPQVVAEGVTRRVIDFPGGWVSALVNLSADLEATLVEDVVNSKSVEITHTALKITQF